MIVIFQQAYSSCLLESCNAIFWYHIMSVFYQHLESHIFSPLFVCGACVFFCVELYTLKRICVENVFLANCKARHKMLHSPSASSLMCVLAMSQSVYTQITQKSLMCIYIQSCGRRALKQVFWLTIKSVCYLGSVEG